MNLYRAHDLTLAGLPVIWHWSRDVAQPGTARITPGGKVVPVTFDDSGRRVELRGRRAPPLWRPADPDKWPSRLPEPVDLIEPPAPAPLATPRDFTEEQIDNDAFPFPGLKLTRAGEAPRSLRDCEARILRCLRTAETFERPRPPSGGWAWPPALVTEIKKLRLELRAARDGKLPGMRESDYEDYYVDRTDVRPLPARWKPTPRDVSDYERRPNPIAWVHKHDLDLFSWRADLPTRSFAWIAEKTRTSVEDVHAWHELAVKRAFERAKRMTGER